MKKSMKIFLRIMPIALVAVIMFGSVFGVITLTDPNLTATDAPTEVTTLANSIWGTVMTVIQILAIGAIVIAGIRYMFASADTKADIKKQTITLIVGAVFVFAAFPIVQFISETAKKII